MGLTLDAGCSSRQGRRKINEDACLVVTPSTGSYSAYGAVLAVADGVGGFPDGEGASRTAVNTLRESYYSSPETWSLEHALRESFSTANHAVITGGEPGRATTLSALILRNRRWMLGHVGDTRVWLLRDDRLQQLTRDHRLPHADIGALITRACGLDETVNADTVSGELAEGDVFVLTSDGVHDVLNGGTMMGLIGRESPAQEVAETLTQRAFDAGSSDNVSACVVRVQTLPLETEADLSETLGSLPIGALPAVGEDMDGFRIDALLHAGRMSSLFKAIDQESGDTVVLKFPNPRYADDHSFVEYFLREEWIGKRVASPHVVKVLPLKAARRTRLYSAMVYHPGETLAERVRRKHGLSVRETLEFAKQLLTGLDHLHRKGVIHRDVKPDNILIGEDRHLRLIDLGVSRIERLEPSGGEGPTPVGTPSYMAPELFNGRPADERSDVYSAGVTIYEMLTGKYPYGEVEPFTHPRFNRFTPPDRYNPDIPAWLCTVLARACTPDPKERYPNVVDLAYALSNPGPQEAVPVRKPPLLDRISPARWRLLFMLSAAANLVLLLVFLLR